MTVALPPPADSLRDFPAVDIDQGVALYRIHRQERAPNFYDPGPSGRFNPPHGVTSFGTCYLAVHVGGAFCEVFGRTRLISTTDLAVRAISRMVPLQPLRIADMTDRRILGLFGLTAEVGAGGPDAYPSTQRWAEALHAAGFDGVRYWARHDPGTDLASFAIFGEPGEQDKPLGVVDTTGLDDPEVPAERELAAFGYTVLPPHAL